MSKFVFFLGGYDAEMVEIGNILKSGNQEVFDNELSWGACLSSYREEIGSLSEEKTPVFIELKPDCSYPKHAKFIDHHDERAGKDEKTSIEQVADLLCIKLDRHQQLISANDKGHIPGMRRLCATKKEIDDIHIEGIVLSDTASFMLSLPAISFLYLSADILADDFEVCLGF